MHAHGLLNFSQQRWYERSGDMRLRQMNEFIRSSQHPHHEIKYLMHQNFVHVLLIFGAFYYLYQDLQECRLYIQSVIVHKENEIYSWSDCACTRQNFSLCVEPRKSNLHALARTSNCPQKLNRGRNSAIIQQRISCPPKSSRPTAMNHLSYFLTPTSTARIDFE